MAAITFPIEGVVLPAVAVGGAVGWPLNGALSTRCLVRASLGVPCPLCGCSRAASRLMHGDIVGALRWSTPAVLLVSVLVGSCALLGIALIKRTALNRPLARVLCALAIIGAAGNWFVQASRT